MQRAWFVGAQKHPDTTSILQRFAALWSVAAMALVRRNAVKPNGKKRQSSKETDQGLIPKPAAAFARIDALAVSSLSSESLGRYYAYKHALLDLEQDDESVVSTLSIYVWDLFEGRTASEIH